MSQADIDKIRKSITGGLNQAYEAATAAEGKLNDTSKHVSSSVRKGISTGLETVSSTRLRLKVSHDCFHIRMIGKSALRFLQIYVVLHMD